MFHLSAYSMQRVGATAALTVVTPVQDTILTTQGNSFVVPAALAKLWGAIVAAGTGLVAGTPTLAQLQSPGLRRVFQQDLPRLNDTFAYEYHDEHGNLFPAVPVPLDPGEGIQAFTAHGALALNETAVYVIFGDGPVVKPAGEVRTIRYTSVCAPVTRVWTLGMLGITQELPQGRYQVVGAKVSNLTEFGAFRLVFTEGNWRPGGMITHGPLSPDSQIQRAGGLGVWGEFDWRELPRFEICSLLAAPVANPAVFLDLIKVS